MDSSQYIRIFYQNIQGISTNKFSDNLLDIFALDYDLVCFSETWLRYEDCGQYVVPDYQCVNKPRSFINKKAKRGAGGIMLYMHNRVAHYTTIVEGPKSEDKLWVRLRSPRLPNKALYVCFCYIPPMGSTVTCNETAEWSCFETDVIKMCDRGDILLLGDMNARTGSEYEIIECDPYFPGPSGTTDKDYTDCKRHSIDATVNTQGRHPIDLCISTQLRILNGRHIGDYPGKFTCHTPRGASVVDYAIISATIQNMVTGFRVGSLQTFSDHCSLELTLNMANKTAVPPLLSTELSSILQPHAGPVRWNKENFLKLLEQSDTFLGIIQINNLLSTSCIDSETGAQMITQMVISLMNKSQKKSHSKETSTTRNKFPSKRWFDHDCKNQKRIVNDAKKY